jgi:hypothetical protein
MQPMPRMMDMITENIRIRATIMGGKQISVRVGFAPEGLGAMLSTMGAEVRLLLLTAGWHTAVVDPGATRYSAPLIRATTRPER